MPIPTDPVLSSQWHLRNLAAGQFDLNVTGVWNPTQGLAYTGAGIRAFVLDSGIDYTHSDLAPNYSTFLDFDFETGANDAFGDASEAHGTAVAGLIGAAANGTGAVGVAYGTELVGYRTAQFISDAWLQDVRDGIHFFSTPGRNGDVMNISQGIANDDTSEFGVGYNAARFDEIEASIGDAVNDGRGGLGATIVKSAGNSRGDFYDVNADDWTNDTRQVVVAAVDRNGFVSSYSSYGAANLVSGFGSPPGQVVTTDRVGNAGYTAGDFTTTFNGTSAAAPMVTGVVSLMYDANGSLGWRDVQSILGASARHVGSAVGGGTAGSEFYAWGWNHASTWNGGGQHFSNDYGYGLVDALAAVRLAETWLLGGSVAGTTANEVQNSVDVLNATVVVPDANATGLTFSGNAFFDDYVDRVTVQMSFSTTFTGDLDLYLTSPDGTVSQLIDNAGGGNDYNGTWTFESQAFRGERAAGNWSVRVVDAFGGDTLTVSDIVIRTFGTSSSADRYVFTNEYSDYDGVAGHATVISDANGGTDTVNAAAVSSASNIRLDGTLGSIDGVGVRFSNIENAIGGDGGDSINGSASANGLFGMRGNDTIGGGGGNDTLDGGDGNNSMGGGDGNDRQLGGVGNDTVFSGAGNDTALGGAGNDSLVGGDGLDLLAGEAGNDVLGAGTGRDILQGGANQDRFDFNLVSESVVGANCDVLQAGGGGSAFDGAGGAAGGERIDLLDIDANVTAGGNQAFLFGGTGKGHVWCVNSGNVTQVFANVDNDVAAEFQLNILDLGVLASAYNAGDFIL